MFFIVLPITFILSCIYIFPEPRTYTCDVTLAPETTGEDVAGGLASVASQFGVNLSGGNTDAIYPMLYPDVMSSNEFLIDLLNTQVKSKDGSINTDYYTYLTKKQKKNVVTRPFKLAIGAIIKLFNKKEEASNVRKGGNGNKTERIRDVKKRLRLDSIPQKESLMLCG